MNNTVKQHPRTAEPVGYTLTTLYSHEDGLTAYRRDRDGQLCYFTSRGMEEITEAQVLVPLSVHGLIPSQGEPPLNYNRDTPDEAAR